MIENRTRIRFREFQEIVWLSVMAAFLALAAGAAAYVLFHMIGLVTNLLFYGRLSIDFANPFDAPFLNGPYRFLVIVIPALGGLLIALMIRYGSEKISGHGEPETIEAILTSRSKIQPKVGLLKPVSAAVTIGSGGPFGAEGPIIQTGGAIGSLVGQVLRVTSTERKILLACGAAAGMAAILGTPIAAILLVIELLLFEFRPRSFIPVAVASAIGGVLHYILFYPPGPLFPVSPNALDFGTYYGLAGLPIIALFGVLCGVVGTALTKLLYRLEDLFDRLPINEFFVPALGGAIVGLIGFVDPSVLGTGYVLISDVLDPTSKISAAAGTLLLFLFSLLILKALAWTVALSTGSSGGTLAPFFLMGGSFGALVGVLFRLVDPGIGLSVSAFALVGMAAVFAAASRATFASIVLGAEVTGVYTIGTAALSALIPLTVGCVAADAVAIYLLGDETVMTGKLARRGIRVRHEYEANLLDFIEVGKVMSPTPRSVPSTMPAPELLATMSDPERPEYLLRSFPIVDAKGRIVGVVTRNDLSNARSRLEGKTVLDVGTKPPVTVHPDDVCTYALERMVLKNVGHLPVVDDANRVVGYLSRGDILRAWGRRLTEEREKEPGFRIHHGPPADGTPDDKAPRP